MNKLVNKTSIAAPYGATDLRVNVLRYDTRQLHWAELQVIPTEQALWCRLDDALGALRWRMMFSMLEGQVICSLSHVDAGAVITRQGYSPRTENVGASFFLSAVRAAQMFGVAAELQGLPRIAVGLRQSDLSGRSVKACFHVSDVAYVGSEIGSLRICDQYRRMRWPKAEEEVPETPDATMEPSPTKSRQKVVAENPVVESSTTTDDASIIRRIGGCRTQAALMEIFEKEPHLVDRPAVFAAISSRMDFVTRNRFTK